MIRTALSRGHEANDLVRFGDRTLATAKTHALRGRTVLESYATDG
jgi:hypothetical protein